MALRLGVEDLRLSLAGVQDKAAICLINKKIALPMNGCPTTHILKPGIPVFENVVENEYICLHIAKQIGLQIPDIEIRHAKDISYLLIQRYDRIVSENTVARIQVVIEFYFPAHFLFVPGHFLKIHRL